MKRAATTIKIWDPIIRIGHWTLAVAFATAWLSGDESLRTHVLAGYTVAAIVATRIVWGLVGPRHARFSQFLSSPRAAMRYVAGLFSGRSRRYLGHNPAGGLMVLALLACLAVTGISGMAVYAIEEESGPLASVFDGGGTGAYEYDDDDEDDNDEAQHGNEALEEAWEEVHETSANLALLLVVMHLAGVVASSIAHRENLVLAMITGRKRTQGPDTG